MLQKISILFLALLLLFTACSAPDTAGAEPAAPSHTVTVEESAPGSYGQRRLALLAAYGGVLGGLTPEQMEEDFDCLWQALQDNYPFLGVARRAGVDGEAVYRQLRGELPGVEDDLAFRDLIDRFIRQFQGIAHFQPILDAGWYEIYRDAYGAFRDNPEIPQAGYLYDILTAPVTVRAYAGLGELEERLAALDKEIQGEVEGERQIPTTPEAPVPNVTTAVLEPDAVAYVKIRGFENTREEHGQLVDFYREVAGYGDLILDLTGNGGGEDMYWTENIVGPNIAQAMGYDDIILMPDTPLLRQYLEAASPGRALLPLSALPALPGLVEEDLAEVGGFYIDPVTVEPGDGAPHFSGRIWVLVDGYVYSSSESFAKFCRATGFATLVGAPTGGDGGGFDPLILALPNSGLLCRFSVQYTTNNDGSNSEEYGTAPDILSPAGEDPLDTCLRAIAELGRDLL